MNDISVAQWESLERNLRARKARQEIALKETTLQHDAAVKAIESARKAQLELNLDAGKQKK